MGRGHILRRRQIQLCRTTVQGLILQPMAPETDAEIDRQLQCDSQRNPEQQGERGHSLCPRGADGGAVVLAGCGG